MAPKVSAKIGSATSIVANRSINGVTADRAWWWPQMAAPVFAGTTRLSGNVFFGDDSAIAIPGVELTAAAARLDVTGGLSAAQIADIRISAKIVPNAESRTLKDA
jgi:translocation and assembly module TamB